MRTMRMPVQQRRSSEARVQSGAQKRDFHRIAAAAVLRAVEMRVVAEHRDAQQQGRLPVIGEPGGLGALVRSRFDLDLARWHAEPSHRHPVLGQGAGLVGEDDGGRAQRLDRRQTLDQRVLPRHAPHAARERERRDDRQALGNGRDGKRDRRFDDEERILAAGEADGDDRCRHDQGRPDELRRQPGELASRAASCPAWASSTSCETRPSSVASPVATTTPMPLPRVTAVPLNSIETAIAETRVARDRLRLLVDGDRTRRSASIHPPRDSRRFDQPQVGRHRVAGVQQHDVAGHQLLGRDEAYVAVAAHAGGAAAERAQRFDRARRLQFGHEADQRVEGEHGDNGAAFLQFAEIEGQRRRGAQ